MLPLKYLLNPLFSLSSPFQAFIIAHSNQFNTFLNSLTSSLSNLFLHCTQSNPFTHKFDQVILALISLASSSPLFRTPLNKQTYKQKTRKKRNFQWLLIALRIQKKLNMASFTSFKSHCASSCFLCSCWPSLTISFFSCSFLLHAALSLEGTFLQS